MKFKSVKSGDYSVAIDSTKKEYKLDPVKDELIETGNTIDLQALINSAVDTCLDKLLNRFYPEILGDGIDDIDDMRDDLEILSSYSSTAEQIREKYDLPDDLSVQEIYKFVNEKVLKFDTLKETKKEDLKNLKEEITEEIKGALKDEKEN